MVIQRQEHIGSLWFTWIYISDTHSEMLITPHQVTEAEALTYQQAYIEAHQYDDVQQASIGLYENKEILRTVALWIKANDPTLTQWNSYLKTLAWYDAYMIRYWLAQLALKLAERGDIDITDFTETQVLAKLKAFIINQPLRRLNKILFGE